MIPQQGQGVKNREKKSLVATMSNKEGAETRVQYLCSKATGGRHCCALPRMTCIFCMNYISNRQWNTTWPHVRDKWVSCLWGKSCFPLESSCSHCCCWCSLNEQEECFLPASWSAFLEKKKSSSYLPTLWVNVVAKGLIRKGLQLGHTLLLWPWHNTQPCSAPAESQDMKK